MNSPFRARGGGGPGVAFLLTVLSACALSDSHTGGGAEPLREAVVVGNDHRVMEEYEGLQRMVVSPSGRLHPLAMASNDEVTVVLYHDDVAPYDGWGYLVSTTIDN